MHTYTAKVLEKIDNPPNEGRPTWNSIRVGIFRVEGDQQEQVGEYIRNYPSFFNTFCYFRQGDGEYALYSPNYTATRVIELPSCKDLGGEEPHTHGFCPTDYYVPAYMEYELVSPENVRRSRCNEPLPERFVPNTMKFGRRDETTGQVVEYEVLSRPVTPLLYYPFGFVSGCIWGDDTSYKIQYLDLSEVGKGIVKREERFGYIALPDKMSLRNAVDMEDYFYDPEDSDPYTMITINIQKRFDLSTGEMQK